MSRFTPPDSPAYLGGWLLKNFGDSYARTLSETLLTSRKSG